MYKLLTVGFLVSLCGCAHVNVYSEAPSNPSVLRAVSSGKIGCAPKDIEISDTWSEGVSWWAGPTWSGFPGVILAWVATCKNKKYVCDLMSGLGTPPDCAPVQ